MEVGNDPGKLTPVSGDDAQSTSDVDINQLMEQLGIALTAPAGDKEPVTVASTIGASDGQIIGKCDSSCPDLIAGTNPALSNGPSELGNKWFGGSAIALIFLITMEVTKMLSENRLSEAQNAIRELKETLELAIDKGENILETGKLKAMQHIVEGVMSLVSAVISFGTVGANAAAEKMGKAKGDAKLEKEMPEARMGLAQKRIGDNKAKVAKLNDKIDDYKKTTPVDQKNIDKAKQEQDKLFDENLNEQAVFDRLKPTTPPPAVSKDPDVAAPKSGEEYIASYDKNAQSFHKTAIADGKREVLSNINNLSMGINSTVQAISSFAKAAFEEQIAELESIKALIDGLQQLNQKFLDSDYQSMREMDTAINDMFSKLGQIMQAHAQAFKW